MEKMNKNLLALKPYLESVKKHCSRLSNEGLTDIILGLAKEVPAKQRIGFLETIDRLSQKQPPVAWDDEILSEIEALKGDIGKRVASIEDGSYYEDHYHEHRYWDYDNELPDTLAAMNLHARLNGSRFDVYENNHPMFCDVMDSRPGELAERDLFLSRWRDALSGKEEKSRDIIDEYRNQKFNRHSAFRRELDSIIAFSDLLR